MEKRISISETNNEITRSGEQKYLKCWGCDYPYLESSNKQDRSLVPAIIDLEDFKNDI